MGESCFETAVRETWEETGLKLTKQHYVGALDFVLASKAGRSKIRGTQEEVLQLYMAPLMFQIGYEDSL